MRIKILLFSISLIVSLALLEISLRTFMHFANNTSVLEKMALDTNTDQDSTFEVYQSKLKTTEIYTFGDSFTNGGNVKYYQTYPYQLWEGLNKKITVNNMGICESSTDVVYKNIKNLLNSDRFSRDKRYYFFILVGAADLFIESCLYSEFCAEKAILTYNFETLDHDVIIKKLKIYKMFVTLLNEIKNRSISLYNLISNIDEGYAGKVIDKCFLTTDNDEDKWNCLKKQMSLIDSSDFFQNDYCEELFKRILKDSDYTPRTATRTVSDLLKLMQLNVYHSLNGQLLINLISHAKMQSVYSSSYIVERIQESVDKLEKTDSKKLAYYEQESGLLQIIKNYKRWAQNVDSVTDLRLEYYSKIISLLNSYPNIRPVFMSYPIKYQLNRSVLNYVKSQNIATIDLESIFSKLIKKGKMTEYIDDWEHCTPKGYGIIASEVIKYISSNELPIK